MVSLRNKKTDEAEYYPYSRKAVYAPERSGPNTETSGTSIKKQHFKRQHQVEDNSAEHSKHKHKLSCIYNYTHRGILGVSGGKMGKPIRGRQVTHIKYQGCRPLCEHIEEKCSCTSFFCG